MVNKMSDSQQPQEPNETTYQRDKTAKEPVAKIRSGLVAISVAIDSPLATLPASKVSAKSINFMAKHGRGLICLALNHSQVNKLNLSLMSPSNNSRTSTAFTVSIEAKKGVTTGISAHDRAHTIKTAIKTAVRARALSGGGGCRAEPRPAGP